MNVRRIDQDTVTLDGEAVAQARWEAHETDRLWQVRVDGEDAGFFPSLESVTDAARRRGGAYTVDAFVPSARGGFRWHSTQSGMTIPPMVRSAE